MEEDREDLVLAIAKLRTSINELNQKGRERLLEAFEKVNRKFNDVYTKLFSGGNAKIEFVEVTAKGHGSNYSEAINNALSNAIAKVNGKSIETNATLKKISQSTKTNEGKEFYSSKEFEKTIRETTKGFVSTFKILNESKSEKGMVQIEIQATIGKYIIKKYIYIKP